MNKSDEKLNTEIYPTDFGCEIVRTFTLEEGKIVDWKENNHSVPSLRYMHERSDFSPVYEYNKNDVKYYLNTKGKSKINITNMIKPNNCIAVLSDNASAIRINGRKSDDEQTVLGSLCLGDKIKIFKHNSRILSLETYTVCEGGFLDDLVFIKVTDTKNNIKYIDRDGRVSEQPTADGYLTAYRLGVIDLDQIDDMYFVDDNFMNKLYSISAKKIEDDEKLNNEQKIETAHTLKDKIDDRRRVALERIEKAKQEEDKNTTNNAHKVKDYIDATKTKVSQVVEYVKGKTKKVIDKLAENKETREVNREVEDILSLDD